MSTTSVQIIAAAGPAATTVAKKDAPVSKPQPPAAKAKPCVWVTMIDNFGPSGGVTFTPVCIAPKGDPHQLANAQTARWNGMPRHLYDTSAKPPSTASAGSATPAAISPAERSAARSNAVSLMAERKTLEAKRAAANGSPARAVLDRLDEIRQALPRLARIVAGVEPEFVGLTARIATAKVTSDAARDAHNAFGSHIAADFTPLPPNPAKLAAAAVDRAADQALTQLTDRSRELQLLANRQIPGLAPDDDDD